MANNEIKTRIKQRYDTFANWQSKNPILLEGEVARVRMEDNTIRTKTGDGTAIKFNDLAWDDKNLYDGNTSTPKMEDGNIVWGGSNLTGNVNPIDAALIPELGANRFAFLPPDAITVEYSRDGGTTWIDYGLSDNDKIRMFSGLSPSITPAIGGITSTGSENCTADCKLRITITTQLNKTVYTIIKKFAIKIAAGLATGSNVTIEKSTFAEPNNFNIVQANIPINGWPGYNVINNCFIFFGGYTTQTSHIQKIRLTFGITGINESDPKSTLQVYNIYAFGENNWITPSNMAKIGQIYSYDDSQNAIFPSKVKSGIIPNEENDLTNKKYVDEQIASNPGAKGDKGDKGENGTSVTVSSVSESTADGGENIVTFSDGKILTVKNGSKGSQGEKGEAGMQGETGKSAYEYAKDGGYTGTEAEFAEALANVGNKLNENLFSFDNAHEYVALLSKNKPDQNYISAQTDNTYGYKDTTNGQYVLTPAGYNTGITDGLELPLKAGSYKISADVYIPSGNTTRTKVKFGAFVAPSVYANLSDFDLGAQDAWITIEKVFIVAEGDTHVYPCFSTYIDNYPFYVRNIKVVNINADEEQGESIAVKKWVVMGDSITEKNSKTLKNYHDYIAELTGINVINMGLSGTGYKAYEDTGNAFYQRILNVPTNADVVTILGSGNDLGGSYTLGDATDTGTDTLCGCINTTIDNLYSVLPTVQLGIITPNPWGGFNPSDESNLMAQYSAKIVEICRLRGIPCLDLYHCSGLRPWDSAFLELAYPMNTEGSARDRVHPNEIGHSIMAPRIKAFLESLIM